MNEEKFEEIKSRVIENNFTRDDALELVAMVESLNEEVEDIIVYTLEEAEIQNEESDAV